MTAIHIEDIEKMRARRLAKEKSRREFRALLAEMFRQQILWGEAVIKYETGQPPAVIQTRNIKNESG